MLNDTTYLIILSLIVIFSYFFDIFSRRTRIPSVILLIFSGITLRYLLDFFGYHLAAIEKILPTLGTIGLILIVLDSGLELELTKKKRRIITQSFLSALLIFLITTISLALPFYYVFQMPFHHALTNAIPLSIISSAVAISSSHSLSPHDREFIVYESSFSDIIGIIAFNFSLINETIHFGSFVNLSGEIFVIILISVMTLIVVSQLFEHIKHSVKFIFITSILVLLYALGKLYHLSSLLLIFVFGLFANNTHLVQTEWVRKIVPTTKLDQELLFFKKLIGESTFLIRTFFFLIFGYTIIVIRLTNPIIWISGLGIVAAIFLIRYLFLRILLPRQPRLSLLLVAPRGLITILLFYSLPTYMHSTYVNQDTYLVIILVTLFVMSFSGLFIRKLKETGMVNVE